MITAIPELVPVFGYNEAIFLKKLHDELQSSFLLRYGKQWACINVDHWYNIFPLFRESTIDNMIEYFKQIKILTIANKTNKTMWYSIDYDVLLFYGIKFCVLDKNVNI